MSDPEEIGPATEAEADVDRAEWHTYRKTAATWAVKLPVDVTVPTPEGEMEAEGGDYLCIDAEGGLYPCDADVFEASYELVGPLEIVTGADE